MSLGTDIYVLLPFDLTAGPATLVITSRGISTPPFAITLVPYAPVLAPTSFWPGIYCAALAPSGTSLVAYGLGPTVPDIPARAVTPRMPPAATVFKPVVTVAGREADVLSSVLVPGRTNDGSYAIDFRVPPGLPVGRHPVTLSVAGYSSNTDVLRFESAVARSAVSGNERPGAPGSIMSVYACAMPLANEQAGGDPLNPGTALGRVTVHVKDSTGVERAAAVLFVSPRQVNFVIPTGTASGDATVTITSGDVFFSTAAIEGLQTYEPIVRTGNGSIQPGPIDFGPPDDELYLLLFGTGLRGRTSIANIRVTIGEVDAPVEYAGPQGEYAGLDQVNVRLPRSLAGRSGDLPISFFMDGRVVPEDELSVPFR